MATKKKAPARGKTRLTSASPSYTVNNVEKSLAWYRDVLGCEVSERWEQDGKLFGVMVTAGDVMFMLGQDDWKKGRNRKKGVGYRIWCETKQVVDKIAAGIKARGGTLDSEPMDHEWGYRDFGVTDPDGFKLTIGKKLAKKRR